MLRSRVDVELLLDLTAELVMREHADDRLLDDAVGMALQLVAERTLHRPPGKPE